MAQLQALQQLLSAIAESTQSNTFIKLTISNKRNKSDDLVNVFIRPVLLNSELQFSFVYRYSTRDITSNLKPEAAIETIEMLLRDTFLNADLFTTLSDFTFLSNRKGSGRLLRKPASSKELPVFTHDHTKKRLITTENNIYLRELGVVTDDFKVRPAMQDKFRQINRYVEIVEGVLKTVKLPADFHVADMGSGKGYLTFALYDHLKKTRAESFAVTGIELRPELVKSCNHIAEKAGFRNLAFLTGSIESAKIGHAQVLIALHACDTATDEAIYRGIAAGSEVIMVAPCCHKQIRKQINPENSLSEITRFGILEERQAEMLTDALRAIILEAFGYKTSVFQFIETEHTPKNVMIAAVRKTKRSTPDAKVMKRIADLKLMFGIHEHHLEHLLQMNKAAI